MRRSWFAVPGLLLLVLSVTVVTRAQQPTATDTAKLIAQDAKFLQDALAKDTLDKKTQKRVRMAALMIAQYAQSGISKDNKNSAALAGVRDRALEIIKAVEADKVADAKKLAGTLGADAKGEGKTEAVALNKHLDFESVMRMFSAERTGGFALEKYLDDLAELKGAVDAAESDKIQAAGHKIAHIAMLAQSYPPEKEEGKKTKKLWSDIAKEMQTAAVELSDAGKAKQDAAIVKATAKLTGTCIKCHDIYR